MNFDKLRPIAQWGRHGTYLTAPCVGIAYAVATGDIADGLSIIARGAQIGSVISLIQASLDDKMSDGGRTSLALTSLSTILCLQVPLSTEWQNGIYNFIVGFERYPEEIGIAISGSVLGCLSKYGSLIIRDAEARQGKEKVVDHSML
jgi:hypothetical protein